VPITFVYGAGLSLSIERNPKRRWLLPYYGVEVGGVMREELGHEYQITPHLGVHLVATRNIHVNLKAGYMMVPTKLEQLGGWRFGLGGNFTLW